MGWAELNDESITPLLIAAPGAFAVLPAGLLSAVTLTL
jgi:hypothetical protein